MLRPQGGGGDEGIIPRLCNNIYERIEAKSQKDVTFSVEVSHTPAPHFIYLFYI